MPHSDFWPFGVNKPMVIKPIDDVKEDSSFLEKQLGDMEGEVEEIQTELAAIKRNRLDLHQRRNYDVEGDSEVVKDTKAHSERGYSTEHSKLPQISKLRAELSSVKNAAEQERSQREKYEAKLKELESKLNGICCTDLEVQENRKSCEEEVGIMKIKIRDMNEEMEDMRITIVEKTEQLQEYRVKYLQAQQQVEELKRQLDIIECDNKQVSEQIQIEIQKMKMQFQEKLQELSPLPDLLKGAQIQLQEAKQIQKLAEDNSQQLSNELQRVKEKLVIAVNNLNQEKAERVNLREENKSLRSGIIEKQKENDALSKDVDESKCTVLRLEEKLLQLESMYKEKATECMKMHKDMEEMKIDVSRSMGRCKERSESMRRYLNTQISELERQLVQSRAQCKAFQKERDEIRQRMHVQVCNLQENFEMMEIRLRAYQSQITALKNSYTMILSDDDEGEGAKKIVPASFDE